MKPWQALILLAALFTLTAGITVYDIGDGRVTWEKLSQEVQDLIDTESAARQTSILWSELDATTQDSTRHAGETVITYDEDRVDTYTLVIDDAADTLTNKRMDADENTFVDFDSNEVKTGGIGLGNISTAGAVDAEVLTFIGAGGLVRWRPPASNPFGADIDSTEVVALGIGFGNLTLDGAVDTEVLTYVNGIGPRWRPAGSNPFGTDIDWAELSAEAQELADDDSLGGLPASSYLTASPFGAEIDWAELSAAAAELADDDSLGGLPASDYATGSDLTTHAALTTGTHGVGASTVASLADIATPTITDFSSAAHDHEDAAGGAQIGWAGLTAAAQEWADSDSLGGLAAGDYLTASPFGASIDWAELSAAAAELADDDSLGGLPASSYLTASPFGADIDSTEIVAQGIGFGNLTVDGAVDTEVLTYVNGVGPRWRPAGSNPFGADIDSTEIVNQGVGFEDLTNDGAADTEVLTWVTALSAPRWRPAGSNPFGVEIDWAELSAEAQELADDDSLGGLPASSYLTASPFGADIDSTEIVAQGIGFGNLTVDGAVDTEVLTYVNGVGPRWRPAGTNPFGVDIDWAELSTEAQELADDDSLGGLPAADYATGSDLTTHAALTTGTHGVGASTVASLADIATPTITDFTSATHDHADAAGAGTLDSTAVVAEGIGLGSLSIAGAVDTEVLTYVTGIGPRWRPADSNPFGAEIDWAELSTAAAELADADSLGSLAAADYATVSALNGHVSDDTGIHGVGGSTVASVLDVTTHAALDTGVHGAGGSTLATILDLATPTITDFTSAAHDHEDAAGGAQIGWAGLTTAAQELADADSLGAYAAADYALQTDLPTQKFCLTILDPTTTEDFTIGHTVAAITVSQIECVLIGTGSPSVTYSLKFATDRSAAGTDLKASGATTNTTTGASESINDATIDANCFIWLESTAVTTTTEIHVTIFYQDT